MPVCNRFEFLYTLAATNIENYSGIPKITENNWKGPKGSKNNNLQWIF